MEPDYLLVTGNEQTCHDLIRSINQNEFIRVRVNYKMEKHSTYSWYYIRVYTKDGDPNVYFALGQEYAITRREKKLSLYY